MGAQACALVLVLAALSRAQDAGQTPALGHWGPPASCYNDLGKPQRCIPEFENAAYGVQMKSNNTCGANGDIRFCIQTGTSTRKSCDTCSHGRFQPYFLTDLHHEQENQTWWQSETMNEGIQYPNQVNLELNLGKAFDITYVRIVFYSPRPESFAIYKRTRQSGEWEPYQFYSATCRETYSLPDSTSADKGAETRALCTSEYSDISPLRGGNVAFSTLEGRPSAYSFDTSPELQEFVTATDIRITLDRLNTFGDEVFGDQQVLQSYWYAIADVAVGAKCKCNGHASKCEKLEYSANNLAQQRRCVCEHHTTGLDCEKCEDFYNDAPWGRASQYDVHECKPCNCNNFSRECVFNKELYERTGHGGHCLNCSGNRDGPNCERCKENYYQNQYQDFYCTACNCNPTGSRSLQCKSDGKCQCKPGVTGDKCDECAPNHYKFSVHGCQPCLCNEAGSYGNVPHCDPISGICDCKDNVEGKMCRECKPGYFNLDIKNEFGCTPCFCYGHSAACHSAPGYAEYRLETSFNRNLEKWSAQDTQKRPAKFIYNDKSKNIAVTAESDHVYFVLPSKYRGDQRASYNHNLNFTLRINESNGARSLQDVVIEGGGLQISIPIDSQNNRIPSKERTEYSFRLHEDPKYHWSPKQSSRSFMSILSNITEIRIKGTYNKYGVGILENIKLESAIISPGEPANWVEMCTCPKGYVGQFCESCAPGYRHNPALGGPFKPCVPCDCNKHTNICDSESGRCICEHNTMGLNCELCAKGYYGSAILGMPDDCKECPCPDKGACIQIVDEIMCTECPVGYTGKRCEGCSDGYFGDPSGEFGPKTSCKLCECNHNIDTNAVANCNRTTGECLKCIYNTAGSNCEKCLPGFYGDALAPTKGDCHQCECNRLGTDLDVDGIPQCDRVSGNCFCKAHIIGRNCDMCADGYFNIESGDGCQTCGCNSEGSYNNTCDIITGQCYCRPGITELQCNKCKPEQYGFSKAGCKECMCDEIGSKELQCDEKGQCPCYDNVEGLHCDMCKENKYDRQRECVDCHSCYNLVQDAVNLHREKLRQLNNMLIDIEKNPTVIPDADFDEKLLNVKNEINKLLKQAQELTDENNTGKTLTQRLDEHDVHLQNITKEMETITASVEKAKKLATKGKDTMADVDKNIGAAQTEYQNALDYLQIDGQKALMKAQNRSDQYGQQNEQMSMIAKESRLLAEKLENEANTIKDIANAAYVKSSEAYKLATDGFKQQSNISHELNFLYGSMNDTQKMLMDVVEKAKVSLNRSHSAYEQAFELYYQVDKITMPEIDIQQIKSDAEAIINQAKHIQLKIDKLKEDNKLMLTDLDTQSTQSQNLLNQSSTQQEKIQDIFMELDNLNTNAQNAIESLNAKYKEAKANNETLKQFHNKVETTRVEAQIAESKMPEIEQILDRISELHKNLNKSQANSEHARDIALKAKDTAIDAKQRSIEKRGEYDKIIETAQLLHDEALQLPGRLSDSDGGIELIESKTDDYKQLITGTKIRVGSVDIDISETGKIISSSLENINKIMAELNTLPNLNDKDLDTLERRLKSAEMEHAREDFTGQIQKLQEAKNTHKRWLKQYGDEISKLEKEVENVKNISESLPIGCFRRVKLEP